MAKKKRGDRCYICGKQASQDDRLPPRNLFPPPRPDSHHSLHLRVLPQAY